MEYKSGKGVNISVVTRKRSYPLDEQERIQRKTFVNWINSYLSKRKPPMRVENLIEDLKDGVRNHNCEDDDDGSSDHDDGLIEDLKDGVRNHNCDDDDGSKLWC